ncbi:MAG TPA: protein translocase subunit SecD [Acidimicrobiales bacterium]|jgi:protein-export membrane protein SecD
MKRPWTSLIGIVVATTAALVAVFATGSAPKLGLDLQGGVAIVLEPASPVDDGILDQTIEILRSRVDALGVAEPDITRQGGNVIVQIPGVTDRARAREIVGQTAELRFRPVIDIAPGDEPTPPEEDLVESEVVLGDRDGELRYRLAPAELTGEIVSTANARFGITGPSEWAVLVDFTAEGSPLWDDLAARIVGRQLAIVLDGIVQSAPTIQTAQFGGSATISGSFSEREAKDLALVLRFGSLPVELVEQTVQEVSATLGRDALSAGLAAGAIGLLAVSLYLIAYYRLLGVVATSSLAVAGGLLWSLISWLGEAQGLALTLAGATGIIVSIGVAVDSNIVYYERVKDEVRGGRTLRSSSEFAFGRAFSTILKADFASLLGAGMLYLLTVGPVRGFALFLGLATLLDLVVSWFFMRPAVILLARASRDHPTRLGILPSTTEATP